MGVWYSDHNCTITISVSTNSLLIGIRMQKCILGVFYLYSNQLCAYKGGQNGVLLGYEIRIRDLAKCVRRVWMQCVGRPGYWISNFGESGRRLLGLLNLSTPGLGSKEYTRLM